MKYTYEDLKQAARYTRISIPNEYFTTREEMVEDFNRWCQYSSDNLFHHYKMWAETVYKENENKE